MAEHQVMTSGGWGEPFTRWVWALDPGAVATGVAWMSLEGNVAWGAFQFDNPLKARKTCNPAEDDIVLVEDYSHGGTFTKEAKQTLEVVGYLRYSLEARDIETIVRHKDKRLSGQSEAAKLMNSTTAVLKKHPDHKDAFSALAHCVTFRREYNGG